MSIQAQWNLGLLVNDALSMGVGILQAATRDNVQPLAILACEKFGNTIAMCPDTCRKIERLMITPESTPVKFLKAAVGFFPDDCATQLSKSLAGVQFLGLAAALVTSMGPYRSGLALELLLKNSTSDRTLLPSSRQLKGLLEALEPRCATSGFVDTVAGWAIFLCGHPYLSNVSEGLIRKWTLGHYHPSEEAIESLVDGLRQIARIGEEKNRVLSIYATFCAPWAIGFTKWCLGGPPTVIFQSDGGDRTTILDNPQSPVLVYVSSTSELSNGFTVSVSSSIKDITDILKFPEHLSDWDEMVTIETYGKLRLLEAGLCSESGKRALQQALPCCINRTLQTLTVGSDFNTRHNKPLPRPSLSPFPRIWKILSLASRMTGIDFAESRVQEKPSNIQDFPDVKSHLYKLKSECQCRECSGESGQQEGETTTFHCQCRNCLPIREAPRTTPALCLLRDFWLHLSSIISEVLALSLFSNPESLLVWRTCPHNMHWDQGTHRNELAWTIRRLIEDNESAYIVTEVYPLIELALRLIGHFSDRQSEDWELRRPWIMSSKYGQTVYPWVLDTFRITDDGYLSLRSLPGMIHFEKDIYHTVVTPHVEDITYMEANHVRNIPVVGPINLCSYKFSWWVQRREDYLVLSAGTNGKSISTTVSPRVILENLANVRVTPSCSHDPSSPLSEPDDTCVYVLPLQDPDSDIPPGHVSVIACAGDQGLRFLALGGALTLRNNNTCLSCSLQYCRTHGFEVLIL